MARSGWHILRDDRAVTVARHLPPRFDLCATTRLSGDRRVSLGAVAHQVRQDMWRALQGVRGFSPVVRVHRDATGLTVEAGGRLAEPRGAGGAEAALAAVLASPDNHRRWLAHAGRRS